MVQVYLSLGSNINAEENIGAAIAALQENYQGVTVSPVYESEAVGFKGENFLNLVVGLAWPDELDAFSESLKNLETALGRKRTAEKFSPRVIDIDILVFGDYVADDPQINIPRDEITKNAYVLLPLQDIAPKLEHPQLHKTYEQLWLNSRDEMKGQKLWKVDWD